MTNEKIKLQKTSDLGFTAVPDSFIDSYMMSAPGEYVKIYLYLLRCVKSSDASFRLDKTADSFGTSEADIRRGLLYWEQKGLLSLEFEDGSLTAVRFGQLSRPTEKAESLTKLRAGSDLRRTDVPNYSLSEIRAFLADNEFAQLQFIAESYIKRPLKQKDLCYILYWHQSLGFSADLIIYLIEVCVSEKKSVFSSIHRTALNWYQHGVRNQADVRMLHEAESAEKEENRVDSELLSSVKKAMGLTDRSLNDREEEFLSTWSKKWNFSPALICEACRRCIKNIHQPSFEYADKILREWHEKGIFNMNAVSADDRRYTESKKKASKPQKAQTTIYKGRSGKDYAELEGLLIGNF